MPATKKLMVIGGIFLFLLFILSFPLYSKQKSELLENYLTYVLSIGAEGVPSEYLIVRNIGIDRMTVDNENNIYIFDETRIKVYDQNGKAKAIIGSPGQGPGEFYPSGLTNPSQITVGPTGFVTALNNGAIRCYNVYDNKYRYIDLIFKTPRISGTQYFFKAFALNPNEYIGINQADEKKDKYLYRTFSIEYLKNNKNSVIVSYTKPINVIKGGSHMSISYLGNLYYDILPGRRIVYTHSRIDELEDASGRYYIIHIYNLDTGEKNQFKIKSNPVFLTEEELKTGGGYAGGGSGDFDAVKDDLLKMRTDYLKKNNIKTHELIQRIFFDGTIAYVETRNRKGIGSEKSYYLMEIVDIEKGTIVQSIYRPSSGVKFDKDKKPLLFIILAIKNGYIYTTSSNPEGYPVVDKYKIDPKVYGK